MRIFCSICKDIYIPYSEVHVTNCGHVYHATCISTWIKQHRTCPQCRASLSQPFRIYFDVEKDEETDRITLEKHIEILQLEKREMEKCKEKLLQENKNFEKLVGDMKERVLSLSKKNEVLKTSVKALKENVTKLTKQNEAVTNLEAEIELWKAKVSLFERTESLIKGSMEDVNIMMQSTPVTELSVKQLCTYVRVLKVQLNKIENKNIMLVKENRDISRALAEEKRKHFNDSEELVKSLKVKNRKLESDLNSLSTLFNDYKRKFLEDRNSLKADIGNCQSPLTSLLQYSKRVKPVAPSTGNANQESVRKNLLDVNLEALLEEENIGTQLIHPVESDKAINQWEDLVCAGPSKSIGLFMRNSRSFGATLYRKDDNCSMRLSESYAFDGLGGRKKIRLGGLTPIEELEKLKQKEKKGVQTFQHKKISEYYRVDYEN